MDHEHNHHQSSLQRGMNKHAGHQTEMFLQKFWVTLIITIPILAYSEIVEKVFDWQAPRFSGSQYLILILASMIFFYSGWVFIVGAYREVRAKLPGMMTLITLAITAAYSFSVFSVFAGREQTLFWELATLIAVMLLGHWIEMKAVSGAQGALKELAKLLPDQAEVIRGGKTQTVLISQLVSKDVVLIRPGSKVPADGIIIEGQSDLDESIITGESKPVSKNIRDRVIAGSINGDGSLKVQIDKIGEATFLAGVMRLVAEAQTSKSRLQMLSDRAALYLTVIAIVAGTITFVAWIISGSGTVFATERLVAVLVIACPHALGLAVPLVASISTTMAARNGLLIKQRLSLEAARTVNTVLFDKTGTLTRGSFGITVIVPAVGVTEKEVLSLAAAVNSHSEHPLAKAMVDEAQKQKLILGEVKNFERVAGKGAQGIIKSEKVLVGNTALINDAKVTIPTDLKNKVDKLSKEGKTVIFVSSNNHLLGAIALADIIREESKEAIASLKQAGIHTAMITGDSEDVAQWVSRELEIDEYYFHVLPGEKAEIVKRVQNPKLEALNSKQYQNSNVQNSKLFWSLRFRIWNLFRISDFGFRNSHKRVVAFVGDGVNDAPALTQADLGIAIGAGTNVAIESAGIILVKNDPRDIVKVIKLSKLTYAKMIQNLFWATGYNFVALPLAAGALASSGIILQPAVAAVLMSTSTIIVALNALLLRRNNLIT